MSKSLELINKNGEIRVSTRVIALDFNKRHNDVVRALENLTTQNPAVKNMYINATFTHNGNQYVEHLLNRDGFSLLVMGFTGERALTWKLKYIEAFNKMEQAIKSQSTTKIDSKFMFQLAQTLEEKEKQIETLNTENDLLTKKQLDWTTINTVEAIVKKIGGKIGYREAWRAFKKELMYNHRININDRYAKALKVAKNKSKVRKLATLHQEEIDAVLSTATALARSYKVDISSIIDKPKSA